MSRQRTPVWRRLVLAVGCAVAAACASNAPVRSGDASTYATLGSPDARGGVQLAPLRPDHLGRHARLHLEPVRVADTVTQSVSAQTRGRVHSELDRALRAELAPKLELDGSEPALRVRVTITGITEASPGLNALTALLLTPVKNGALAVEAEILDGEGNQIGLILWADEGGMFSPADFAGNFRREAHAVALTKEFATALAAYLMPLIKAHETP